MKNSDTYPFHHRQITPWYATTAVCWTVMILMLAIFGFALVGVSVARSEAAFGAYLWVPATLGTISGTIVVLLAWRLIKRRLLQRRTGQSGG